jgi:hypothetical protein
VNNATGVVTLAQPLTPAVGNGAMVRFISSQISMVLNTPIQNQLPGYVAQVPGVPRGLEPTGCFIDDPGCMTSS